MPAAEAAKSWLENNKGMITRSIFSDHRMFLWRVKPQQMLADAGTSMVACRTGSVCYFR